MLLILFQLLDYLTKNEKIEDSALLEYKRKLDEEEDKEIKKTQAYKEMIELLDSLLKFNIKNINDISNLKNAVQNLIFIVRYDETEHGQLSDFLQEHSKSQTSLHQS